MAYQILRAEGDLLEVKLKGTMLRRDLDELQARVKRLIEQGKRIRFLAVLEDFLGWEKGADWGDASFLFEHGDDLEKMAIVGETRWQDDAYAFVGKGLRRTAIEYFPPSALQEARQWLTRP
jgi:hypothetical protein